MDCKIPGIDFIARCIAAHSFFYGMIKTRTNYDILSYLPDTLETIEGQDIMVGRVWYGCFLDGGRGRHGYEGCTEAGG